jgi:hypothetical protein
VTYGWCGQAASASATLEPLSTRARGHTYTLQPPRIKPTDQPPQQTQEMWSFLVPATWLLLLSTPQQRARAAAPANRLLLGLYLLHYFYRGLVYPWRTKVGRVGGWVVFLLDSVRPGGWVEGTGERFGEGGVSDHPSYTREDAT